MTQPVAVPLWLLILILALAAVTTASHFLLPSVRWFFRRRMERAVARLNARLARPIAPFKLLERHDRILRLIYDPQVMEAVVLDARERGVPETVSFERARRFAREIVPGFSATTYFGFAVRAARWLSQSLYSVRVGAHDDAALRAMDPDATVIFVMNHRSNMDYVLVTWLVSDRMTLSYAVGEWARVWPLTVLIRGMGAYFIRRRNRDMLYRRVLARYVQMATAEGVSQAIFPEGALSLDGRIGAPKVGLIGDITAAIRPGEGRDVIFVPVAIGYDRVLEDRVLTEAFETGVRRFRARPAAIAVFVLRMVWRKLRGRFGGFGTAAVNFGHPLSLRALRAAGEEPTPKQLADRLMAGVCAAVPVLPVPLVAAALVEALSSGPVPRAEVPRHVAALRARLQRQGASFVPGTGDPVAEALPPLLARGIVTEGRAGIAPAPGMAGLLAFYAAPVLQLCEAGPEAEGRPPPGDDIAEI